MVSVVESHMEFVRQERVVATSEGALFTQTLYESGGLIVVNDATNDGSATVHGIDVAGAGWERFLDAKIPDQMPQLKQEAKEDLVLANSGKPSTIGRYTLVCDGAAMAALVGATLGVATQLDRALGYEADARGTSFLDDPLGMVGHAHVASPLVTLTADRSAPAGLATVKWDDEGVEPEPFTLIKEGVLEDFQTTREQAAWLAPYYQQVGRPVRSHGCAAAEDAQKIVMQMMPNLSLEPSPAAIRLEDLVADVKDGILIEGGQADSDFQARTGLLVPGNMREIKNGRLGRQLTSGAVLFNSQDLWKQVQAVGGPSTQMITGQSSHVGILGCFFLGLEEPRMAKGQPQQSTSYSVRAAAAKISNQPLIDPRRKA